MADSCITCSRLQSCTSKKISGTYICSKYSMPVTAEELWNEASDGMIGDGTGVPTQELGESAELDLVTILDEIYDPTNKVINDARINDKDFKEFPNIWEFSHSKKGLGINLFSRQLYTLLKLFHEICPICSDPKYQTIEDVPLKMRAADFPEHFQLLHHGVCPKCKSTKRKLFSKKLSYPYQELGGLAGQRVGKSLIAGVAGSYITHKTLKLQNPSLAYGILPTTLVGTFVALTYDAAYEQLWLPFSTLINQSEWFKGYHAMLKYYEGKYGEELFNYSKTTVHYRHRGLLIYPSGPNKKTLRGKTRIFGAVDELDFFGNDQDNKDSVKANGVEVYKSLNNSLLTVRVGWKKAVISGNQNICNGYQLNISSPQSARGVLTEMVYRNKDSKFVFTIHLATWEVNPNIKKSDLAQEYADDPEKADRDFGAIPPDAENPFMYDRSVVKSMFGTKANAVDYSYRTIQTPTGATRRGAEVLRVNTPPLIPPAIMSIDAGFSANSFSLTIGYVEILEGVRSIKTSAIVEIIPERGLPLDYDSIAESVIFPLIPKLNVKAVFADRWNSLKILHEIEAKFKIPALQYSIKYKDFFLVRSYMESGNVTVPRPEVAVKDLDSTLKFPLVTYPLMFKLRPLDHFYVQACTVKDTGKTVDKGSRLTDDTWRALCLMCVWLLNEKFCNEYVKDAKAGNGGIGVVGLYSSGLSQAANSSMGVVGSSQSAPISIMELYKRSSTNVNSSRPS